MPTPIEDRDNLLRVCGESNNRRIDWAIKLGLTPDASWQDIESKWAEQNPNNENAIYLTIKENVIAACKAGKKVDCLALEYNFSPKTIYSWLKKDKATSG